MRVLAFDAGQGRADVAAGQWWLELVQGQARRRTGASRPVNGIRPVLMPGGAVSIDQEAP
jgi:hypothetical protein